MYSFEYTYNADGIRTSKTLFGITYEYILNGSQPIGMRWTESGTEYLMLFIYDDTGSPVALKYRTSAYAVGVFDIYFFEKNLQGDIIAIYDETGSQIGTYKYNAWGALSWSCASGTSAFEYSLVYSLNPFRYRGYIYDFETGLYYLQSRYYNPTWGRFLNADQMFYLGLDGSFLSYNLYAYCKNNPIKHTDPTGNFVAGVFVIMAGLVAGVVTGNDIYQIVSGNVSTTLNDTDFDGEADHVQIKDSYKILNPMVRLYYSVYINHINSETKNVVKGSSIGLEFEWALHNAVYFGTFGNFDQARDLDVGASIYSDNHGAASSVMKFVYMIGRSPVFWIADIIANGGW